MSLPPVSAKAHRPYPPVQSNPMLSGTKRHPHARAVLTAALPPGGSASHAYLFHGPAGAGKRAVARAFAAELLADGARDPDNARERVGHGVHPDLTWVAPTGAAVMRVEDIDESVVASAYRTPFEATRRVFVLERVETMNDQAANRMLKTLEEPPAFAHLVLLSDRPGEVLPTIASRCQHVRFDALPADDIAALLGARGVADPAVASACARLALGDADRAVLLALGDGPGLRAGAEAYARACISGALGMTPWAAVLDQARHHGAAATAGVEEGVAETLDLLPRKERKKAEREGGEAAKRAGRRARTAALDLSLQLAGLWFRDVACLVVGATELAHHADRAAELAADAARFDAAHRLRDATAIVDDARAALVERNPTEELLLEALASKLQRTLAAA
jgi:DNA polymerase-3 subunit delta'